METAATARVTRIQPSAMRALSPWMREKAGKSTSCSGAAIRLKGMRMML